MRFSDYAPLRLDISEVQTDLILLTHRRKPDLCDWRSNTEKTFQRHFNPNFADWNCGAFLTETAVFLYSLNRSFCLRNKELNLEIEKDFSEVSQLFLLTVLMQINVRIHEKLH